MELKTFKLGKRNTSTRVIPDSKNASEKLMRLYVNVVKGEDSVKNPKKYRSINIPSDIPKPYLCFFNRKRKASYVVFIE